MSNTVLVRAKLTAEEWRRIKAKAAFDGIAVSQLAGDASPPEQVAHAELCTLIRGTLSTLRLSRCEDEDVRVAKARLENWLTENDGRWVK